MNEMSEIEEMNRRVNGLYEDDYEVLTRNDLPDSEINDGIMGDRNGMETGQGEEESEGLFARVREIGEQYVGIPTSLRPILEGFSKVARLYRDSSEFLIPEFIKTRLMNPSYSATSPLPPPPPPSSPSSPPLPPSAITTTATTHLPPDPLRVKMARWEHQMQVNRSMEIAAAEASTTSPSSPTLLSSYTLLSDSLSLDQPPASMSSSGRLRLLREDERIYWEETTSTDTGLGEFEILSTESTPPVPEVTRERPVYEGEWKSWFDGFRGVPGGGFDGTVDGDAGVNGVGVLKANLADVKKRIFRGGVEKSMRGEVWRYLFGVYPWKSTHVERLLIRQRNCERYEALTMRWKNARNEGTPESKAYINYCHDASCRIEKDVPRTDFHHPFYKSSRNPLSTTTQHPTTPPSSPPTAPHLKTSLPFTPRQRQLYNLLMTFICGNYHPSSSTSPNSPIQEPTGYVQGMADLASTFLIIFQGDEVDTLVAFENYMTPRLALFHTSGLGMHHHLHTLSRLLSITDPSFAGHLKSVECLNLFFCYRWLLVSFRREFGVDEACRVWEVVESAHFGGLVGWEAGRFLKSRGRDGVCGVGGSGGEAEFGVFSFYEWFVALAILDEHRDAVMRHLVCFDDILKYVNGLSMKIPVNAALEAAELLYHRFLSKAAVLGVLSDESVIRNSEVDDEEDRACDSAFEQQGKTTNGNGDGLLRNRNASVGMAKPRGKVAGVGSGGRKTISRRWSAALVGKEVDVLKVVEKIERVEKGLVVSI
ncbi:GTPase activating protein [Blyttiomyces sp. JEL0837]|nr:GTPase activating protein [Blyttiomyces sp. JEL0837]